MKYEANEVNNLSRTGSYGESYLLKFNEVVRLKWIPSAADFEV
jgi:hypothetical protein